MIISILGRQPAIGIAELESLYGADSIRPVGSTAVMVDADVDFARLGGSVKIARHLTTLDTTNPQKAFDYCRRVLAEHVGHFPEGKIKVGVSLYDLDMPVQKINANVLSLKKVIRATGRSVRVVPNTDVALSSAQTYHNQLTSPVGMELIFVRDGDQIQLGQVSHVQDIDAYTLRDRSRPKRDAFVGMLPPKLAQTIVNLAIGRWKMEDGAAAAAKSHMPIANSQLTVLDPFCGTGVVLMEASLMDYSVYGSDNSQKMVDFTQVNMEWLHATPAAYRQTNKADLSNRSREWSDIRVELGDATDHIWRQPITVIACEGYLGQPLGGQVPSPKKLQQIIHDCDVIMRGFLTNISSQLQPGTRLCVAMPTWFIDDNSHHLPVLSSLVTLGYTRQAFTHAAESDLIYRRDDQSVGRELVVLTKNS